MGKDDSFTYKGVTYDVTEEGDSLYSVSERRQTAWPSPTRTS